MNNPITQIEEIDSTLNPITIPDGLELLGHIRTQPVNLRRFSRSLFKIQDLLNWFRDKLLKFEDVCQIRVHQYFITEETSNPAVIWPGTTWIKLEGKVLVGAGGALTLGSQGGRSSLTLSLSNIPGHTHSFSGTTSTTGNHNHRSGNHRHRVDNHAHSQPQHQHIGGWPRPEGFTFSSGKYGQIKSGSAYNKTSSQSNGTYGLMYPYTSSAGSETTGGSAPYTDYQNPTTDTKGSHNHTMSGTTGSSGSGSEFNILNPYRAVNIWRRTA